MIHFRRSHFSKSDSDFMLTSRKGERVSEVILRIVDFDPSLRSISSFRVIFNSEILDESKYDSTVVGDDDKMIVLPNLLNGDTTGTVLQIGILIASVYTGGAVGALYGKFAGALASAAVLTIGNKQLQYLLPTPSINTQGDPQRSSQTYMLDSQANQMKPFAKVHKVYGTHRVYPNLAATPYTELELDPETGKLAQFFYAIYHISQGQVSVSDIRIGNTSIDLFAGSTYRLVDINKPNVDADEFDAAYSKNFTLYKGSVSAETVGSEINSDESAGGAESGYLITRNCPTNTDLKRQQIVVNLLCPRGLLSYNSSGSQGAAYIDVDIHFSKVGENVWRAFNDAQYVDNYTGIGSSSAFRSVTTTTLYPCNFSVNGPFLAIGYKLLSNDGGIVYKIRSGVIVQIIQHYTIGYDTYYPDVIFSTSSGIAVGDALAFNGEYVGIVTSVVAYFTGYVKVTASWVKRYIPLFKCTRLLDVATLDEFVEGTEVITVENNSLVNRIVKDTTLGRLVIGSNSTEAHLASVKFTPKENAEYKVRIVRRTSRNIYSTTIVNGLVVASIISRYDQSPITVTKRNSYLEVRLKATGQLSGAVDNLSVIASSVLEAYNGTAWVKQVSSNPAWVLADLLTGEVNKKAISKSKLDTASLLDWATYCDAVPTSAGYTYYAKRYSCNFVLDFEITLQSLIAKVTNACQASLRYSDGLYGVLQDRLQTVPVQIFTERNSNNFTSTRTYSDLLHAIKVTFVDPNKDWQPNTVTVYRSGYTEANATKIEPLDSFACINVEQAFRFGRYFLFQDTYRRENMGITSDFESLACQRGDFILLTQEVMQVGGKAARVLSVDSGTGEITTDDDFDLPVGTYKYTFRNSETGVITEDQSVTTVVNSDTFILGGTLPSVGDLIVVGLVGYVTFKCIVKAIEALDNESAQLSLIEQASDIYNFEDITAIAAYDPQLSATTAGSSKPPGEVTNLIVDESSYNIVSMAYQHYVKLDWDSPQGPSFKLFEVYVDFGDGYTLVDSCEISNYTYIVENKNLGKLHTFKVLAVSPSGKKMTLIDAPSTSTTPISKTTRPSNVTQFNADTLNETLQLFWTKVDDLDIKSYIIRYSQNINGVWAESDLLQEVSGDTSLISVQARVGAYFVKAVDINGNESALALKIQTTITSLNNITSINTISDAPTFSGIFDRCELVNGSIVLKKSNSSPVLGEETYYSEGYYYFNQLLELDQLTLVRLQSNLVVSALTATDILANWTTLSEVAAMMTPQSADWGAEIQYRATESVNPISNWTTLSSITTLAEGSANVWTDYRKLLITDVQAKFIQFRLKLSSFVSSVSPIISSAAITATMSGRSENKNDLVATGGTKVVTFDFSFYAVPAINVTVQSMTEGDKWDITSKTKDGFTVSFTNAGLPVTRTFDFQAIGYGKKSSEVL